MNLGGRLKQAREFRDLTQEKLAEMASTEEVPVSQAVVSILEKRDSKRSTFLFQLARALNVSPEWLQDGNGESGLEPVKEKSHTTPSHELSRMQTRAQKTSKSIRKRRPRAG